MLWWLLFKIIGVIMIVIGGFVVIFLPGIQVHQEAGRKGSYSSFGLGGIVVGLILIIVGGFILFSP
jgi:hypothetical protein